MSIESFVQRLQRSGRSAASMTAVQRLPARKAVTAAYPESVPSWMRDALRRRGVAEPYSHQAAAWELLGSGRDLVVVTPTASGKTLCYTVPIVTMLRDDRDGCALFLYPTKALSQDQCAELNELLGAAGVEEEAQVYDGDTPADIRRRVRNSVRAVLTNPDMLHASILPHHEKWRRLFASLKYVVIDEMHTYRGVFGSHVANVLRRLMRICHHYGATPQFVFTSATIANPQELAHLLTGRDAGLVDESGAPSGEKLFCLYNPPIIDADQQRRQSPGAAARRMVTDLLESEHATIVFTRSRKGVEILSRKLKESLENRGHKRLAERTTGYRGGYLPQERRRIEKGLRSGQIRGVVSTNALELGIDIGSLDACLIAGYPGTIASTWQQAGRSGRRQSTSLAMLIAGDDPVDQYLVSHPEYFFEASPEHARIDADNLRVLAEHLKCAVFELPFELEEPFGTFDVESTQEVLSFLSEQGGLVHVLDGRWRWSAPDNYPATGVNIRAIYDENFVIVDTTRNPPSVLGEIDFESAHKTVHEKAIYQHAARFYEVHRLDYPDRKAYVRSVDPEYFTQAIDETRVFVLEKFDEAVIDGSPLERGWGEVRVATRFTGYKKLRFKTFENIGYGELNLPDLEKHTTAYWCVFPSAHISTLGLGATELGAAIAGIGNAMHTVAVVHLMCARGDLHVTLGSRLHAETGGWDDPTPVNVGDASFEDPTIYLYDDCPGGVGFSEKLHALHVDLLAHTQELIERCPCEDGCPSCVGPAPLVGGHAKAAALAVLRGRRRA